MEVAEPKKYRFITVRQERGEMFQRKPVYRIFNNKSGGQLGILSYYTPWRQYVFSSNPECVFNDACLREVLDYLAIAGEAMRSAG